jgi:hypothetical protein
MEDQLFKSLPLLKMDMFSYVMLFAKRMFSCNYISVSTFKFHLKILFNKFPEQSAGYHIVAKEWLTRLVLPHSLALPCSEIKVLFVPSLSSPSPKSRGRTFRESPNPKDENMIWSSRSLFRGVWSRSGWMHTDIVLF